MSVALIAFETARVLSIVGFSLYGWSCLMTERMVVEFKRYGLPGLRRLTGALEIAGALGLAIGYVIPLVGTLAAAGLSLLMVMAVGTRIRVRDPLVATLPALLFAIVIAYLLGYVLATGRWR